MQHGQQLILEFNPLHGKENNALSQAFLDEHRIKFNNKCKQTFERLIAGERLTVLHAANTGISSLPRRIKDLREFGVIISDEWIVVNESEVIRYYMTEADKAATLKNIIAKIQLKEN